MGGRRVRHRRRGGDVHRRPGRPRRPVPRPPPVALARRSPLLPVLAIAVGTLPAWLRRRRCRRAPVRRAATAGGRRHDPLRGGHRPVRRTPRRRCCATSRCTSPRASCASSPAARAAASRRCSARSTGSCRTSPAGRSAAGSTVAGLDTRTHPPRELADVVGVVGQDPLLGFVTDTVEDELAYGMEQLAMPPADDAQARRGDARPARHRRPAPPSAADPVRRPAAAGRDRLGAHRAPAGAGARRADLRARPDRRRGRARRAHPAGARPRHHRRDGRAPARARRRSTPTCVVHDRRRRARSRSARRRRRWRSPVSPRRSSSSAQARRLGSRCRCRSAMPAAGPRRCASASPASTPRARGAAPTAHRAAVLSPAGSRCATATSLAVATSTSSSPPARWSALMGRNGSGKSSLLWALAGRRHPLGRLGADRARPGSIRSPPSRRSGAAWSDWCPRPRPTCSTSTTRRRRVRAGRRASSERPAGTCRALLDRLVPGIADDAHPRDLSEGQRLALVLAVQLSRRPAVVLLDEPTRGLDYHAKRAPRRAGRATRRRRARRRDRDPRRRVRRRRSPTGWSCSPTGEVVADGPTAEVVVASPASRRRWPR